MGHTPVPDDGVIYMASVEELEGLPVAAETERAGIRRPAHPDWLLQWQ